MKTHSRMALFYKYLLSYVFIFMLPLIILGAVIYTQAVSNVREEIVSSNMTKLDQVKALIDQQYQGLEKTAAKIAMDPMLLPYRIQGGYEKREAIRELAKYQSNNAVVDDLFLYFKGDNVIYSGSGYSSLETLSSSIYRFESWDLEQVKEQLNRMTTSTIVPAREVTVNRGEEKRMITYMVPVPIHDPSPYAVVMYLIDEVQLTDLIQHILGHNLGSMYILNEDMEILASRSQGGLFSQEEITRILSILSKNHVDGVSTITWEGVKLSVASIHSDRTGWNFLTVMPTEQFYDRVIKRRILVLSLLMILLVTGLGTAISLSKFYYRPIRTIVERTQSYWGQLTHHGKRNEWETIGDTIQAAYESQRKLETRIESQLPLIREQLLTRLLKGQIQSVEELARYGNLSSSVREGNWYFSICMLINETGRSALTVQTKEAVGQALEEMRFECWSGFGVELLADNQIAVIGIVRGHSPELQQQAVAMLYDWLQRSYFIQPTMGVGALCDDIRKVNRSFVEAQAALSYRVAIGDGTPIYFTQIEDKQQKILWFPLKEQYLLAQSLKQGDAVVAKETLKVIFGHIRSQEQSYLFIQCMCYDVVNNIIRAVSEWSMEEYLEPVKQLVQFQTVEQLEEQAGRCIDQICSAIQARQESDKRQMIAEIMAYIEVRYQSEQLSLEEVAERFGFSISRLSRTIKEEIGDTFTNHLIRLRVEAVKRKLLETTKPIQEIVLEAGYSDTSSFIRRFKKQVGMTPGQYRQHHHGRN